MEKYVFVGREGFSKVSTRSIYNQILGLPLPLTSEQRYLSDPRKDWEKGDRGQTAKALRKHQPERGGIQRPDRSCHPRGYHNYPWDWAQTQVTP